MSAQALLKEEEDVTVPGLVVSFDKNYEQPRELKSDCYGNLYCPDTGRMLFCHRIPSNLGMLYDTF